MSAYDKFCIYTQDYSFLRTTSFVFSFYTSMTAPCNDLNPASTYCARENSDGQLYVVGVDAVQGRRLLGTVTILDRDVWEHQHARAPCKQRQHD
jgi:hypothetical protein